MNLHFVKMNPAGNTTVYIFDTLPREIHGRVAQVLMKKECLCADQVGFVEEPASPAAAARLQMMGCEFCGNATRALAALLTLRNYPNIRYQKKPDQSGGEFDAIVPLEVSGYEGLIYARVSVDEAGRNIWAETPIPAPLGLETVSLDFSGSVRKGMIVEFPGILHVVLKDVQPGVEIFEMVRRQLINRKADALGVMFYDEVRGFLTPLVYVASTQTLIWEGSCGSGSAAVAAALAWENQRDISLELKQPGGSLAVDIVYAHGGISQVRLKGPVDFVAEGTVCVKN
jgi:diaminopimelate epimerase